MSLVLGHFKNSSNPVSIMCLFNALIIVVVDDDDLLPMCLIPDVFSNGFPGDICFDQPGGPNRGGLGLRANTSPQPRLQSCL